MLGAIQGNFDGVMESDRAVDELFPPLRFRRTSGRWATGSRLDWSAEILELHQVVFKVGDSVQEPLAVW